MPSMERSEVVPYSPDQMYDLVMDIESYPEFLSWCSKGRVLTREEDNLTAELTLEYKGLRKSFSTRNAFQRPKLVEMRLLEGPFRFLEGVWTFEPLEGRGTRVHMSIQFEFVNRMLSMMVGPVFHRAVDTLVADFRKRAESVYGRSR
ncbi:type II toxin-antitoxin system RatA family toxin [Thiohalorhabdus methylotrophus]|uniref:Type II toxin-antitoxin system RatA family toxin n=1 Tax=Thiohalorhabdus methylotrophus TaxID=3242694 RepID=A0ABV4TYJ8_9GAMM